MSQNLTKQKKTSSNKTNRILLLGRNGTGKSTFSIKFIETVLKAGRRALVVTSHFEEWEHLDNKISFNPPFEKLDNDKKRELVNKIKNFKGTAKLLLFNPKDLILLNYFTNGLIVLDDCRNYAGSKTEDVLNSLFISSRQKNVDFICAAHGFGQMPPAFFSFATHLVLFKVNDSPKIRDKQLNNWRELLEIQEYINAEYQKGNEFINVPVIL